MAIKLIVPLRSFIITQNFGENPEAYGQWTPRGHNGIDYATPNGTPVMAAASGIVGKVAFEQGGYGHYITLNHVDGSTTYSTQYAHLQKAAVSVGQSVQAGDVIGYSNNTGWSTGPHLHFALKINGADPYNKDYVDPQPYIDGNSPPPPPPPVDNTDAVPLPDLSLKVIKTVDIRSGPGAQYASTGTLEPGATITGKRLKAESVWVEFESGKWCALAHYGMIHMKVSGSSQPARSTQAATDFLDAVPLPDLTFEVIISLLNVRSGPDVTYASVPNAALSLGNKVTGRRLYSRSMWVEFESGKWCALAHAGVVYLQAKDSTTPIPPPPPPPPPPDNSVVTLSPNINFLVTRGPLNIRLGPRADADTSGAILAANSSITGRRIQFQPNGSGLWVEIEQSRWCAFAHSGVVYLKATDISETDLASGGAVFPVDFPFEVLLNVNIRRDPSTANSPDGTLSVGTIIQGKRIKFQPNGAWIGFKKDNGQDRWCAFFYDGVNYLKVR